MSGAENLGLSGFAALRARSRTEISRSSSNVEPGNWAPNTARKIFAVAMHAATPAPNGFGESPLPHGLDTDSLAIQPLEPTKIRVSAPRTFLSELVFPTV